MKWTKAVIDEQASRYTKPIQDEMATVLRAVRDQTIEECRKAVCGCCRDGTLSHGVACRAIVNHFRDDVTAE